jgi:polycystin 1L2
MAGVGARMAAMRRMQQLKAERQANETEEETERREAFEAREHLGVVDQLKQGIFTRNPKLIQTLVYFCFCGCFFWVMDSTQGGTKSYELVQNIRGSFSAFTEVSDGASWFEFMESTFPDVAFPVAYYNGDEYEDENLGNVADHFMLIGAVGVRQVRVKNNTCSLKGSDKIFPYVKNCFGEYSTSTEDRGPFGPEVEPGDDRAFKYSTSLDLGCKVGCSTETNLGITYGGGGFFEQLPSARNASTNQDVKDKIEQLRTDRWIDRQTRAIFVEFTVYSLTSKLLAVVSLWYEIKASGRSSAYIQVLPVKLGHFYLAEGTLTDMLCEFIMIFLTLGYTASAFRTLIKEGCMAYFGSGWNVFDIINYICMYAAFACRYAAILNASDITFPPGDEDFVYLSAPAAWVKIYKYLLGFNCIFTFFKILKYLSHIPMFARLVKILGASVEDVASFSINLIISMTAFAGAFHLTYGNHMAEFATWGESFMTLFRYSMGDWDIVLLESYQPTIGILYFMLWTLLAICLLLNMFVAIIMESYDKVNQEEEKMSFFEFAKAQVIGKGEVAVVVSNEKPEEEVSYTHTCSCWLMHLHKWSRSSALIKLRAPSTH